MRNIFNFCIDAHLFLSEHYKNGTLFSHSDGPMDSKDAAIALHCKAGKGRTGLMLTSFLLFAEYQFEKSDFPQNAIDFYNDARTMNRKGLTIASQIRYVNYFYHFIEREIKKPFFANSLTNYNQI